MARLTDAPSDDVDGGPVERISAITFFTAAMAVSVAFYESLGFELVHGGAGDSFCSFRAGTGFVNLQHEPGRNRGGRAWGRVVLWVADVDAVHARAVRAGHQPLTEPADAPWGERYFHLRDPDGHELSFARPL